MEKIILGIDPGTAKPSAWGLWSGAEFWNSGLIKDMSSALALVQFADKVYIESQFVKMNPGSALKLAHEAGKIIGLCELAGTEYELVAPSAWQNRVNYPGVKPVGIKPHRWRKQKAEMLVKLAADITGCQPENDDEAAGILIAYSMGVLQSGS